jgi:hypothetical protein
MEIHGLLIGKKRLSCSLVTLWQCAWFFGRLWNETSIVSRREQCIHTRSQLLVHYMLNPYCYELLILVTIEKEEVVDSEAKSSTLRFPSWHWWWVSFRDEPIIRGW